MGLSRDNLTTIATRTGCKVVAAWSTRNAGAMGDVRGVVMHHTGSAWGTAIAPTLGIVQNGRSDLQNALCTYYIDRAGTIYLITEKIAWHAGAGAWRGLTDGNGHLLGIEAESDGKNWTAETVESYVRLVAEICRYLGVDPNIWAIRHAQWAPTRKIDFSGLNEADFRAKVAARLSGAAASTPMEGDDMKVIQSTGRGIALVGAGYYRPLSSSEEVNAAGKAWGAPVVGSDREFDLWVDLSVGGKSADTAKLVQILGTDTDGNGQDRLGDLWEQADRNKVELLAALVGKTSGAVDPAALAAMIPDDIAEQVASKLAERLQS